MSKKFILVFLLLILLAACAQQPPAPATDEVTTSTQITPSSNQQPEVPAPGIALPMDRGELFSASGACSFCHTNMVDEAGTDVSIDTQWRSTMLANAARDPYWLATVRSETSQAPQLNADIQKKCATCHMPMAEFSSVAEGSKRLILDLRKFVSNIQYTPKSRTIFYRFQIHNFICSL